jgi:hypothetical protein
VQDAIGAKNAAAFDLAAGCSGFVYSLIVASQMLQAGIYKKDFNYRCRNFARSWTSVTAIPACFLAMVPALLW